MGLSLMWVQLGIGELGNWGDIHPSSSRIGIILFLILMILIPLTQPLTNQTCQSTPSNSTAPTMKGKSTRHPLALAFTSHFSHRAFSHLSASVVLEQTSPSPSLSHSHSHSAIPVTITIHHQKPVISPSPNLMAHIPAFTPSFHQAIKSSLVCPTAHASFMLMLRRETSLPHIVETLAANQLTAAL